MEVVAEGGVKTVKYGRPTDGEASMPESNPEPPISRRPAATRIGIGR
jgi:hypothetical protein